MKLAVLHFVTHKCFGQSSKSITENTVNFEMVLFEPLDTLYIIYNNLFAMYKFTP